jgi:hypothetical protein
VSATGGVSAGLAAAAPAVGAVEGDAVEALGLASAASDATAVSTTPLFASVLPTQPATPASTTMAVAATAIPTARVLIPLVMRRTVLPLVNLGQPGNSWRARLMLIKKRSLSVTLRRLEYPI